MNAMNILSKYDNDKNRLLDILMDAQEERGYISQETITEIADALKISESDIEMTLSFYHFFSRRPLGKYNIYLNNSIVANMKGRAEVELALRKETDCDFGGVSADGLFSLHETSCIGMSDQEPAALINGKVFSRLTPYSVSEIIKGLKAGKSVDESNTQGLGGGNNGHPLMNSVVNNNIRKIGPILSMDYQPGTVLNKLGAALPPERIIDIIKRSGLRGRGGAGFPTGLKWDFCRRSACQDKYVVCNADEGEPGTFKDRVLLTEYADLLFEGMAIAGYAIGASQGIIFLRYEYKYMKSFLEHRLQEARKNNLLGNKLGGIEGFDFDIRIQLSAGAYVCGEESAALESAEGKRGEPRDKPPFPVEKGYLGRPTVINNVETLCAAVKIIHHGDSWFNNFGEGESTGTKLLSISGDCEFPGIYELEWGFSIYDILAMVKADEQVQAVQVGGPSGSLIGANDFNRRLSYEDLATGGSIIIFNSSRNLLKDVVLNFVDFFIDESCGACSTCRIMPVTLRNKLLKLLNGNGVLQDVDDLLGWSKVLKASRCGLGQSAANPIIYSIKNFRHLYERIAARDDEFRSSFDLGNSVKEYQLFSGHI
jgi:[NiFe] hydrogenase diaphorase moiety large subunit